MKHIIAEERIFSPTPINLLDLKKQELISQILHSINSSHNFAKLISEIVALIKDYTGIQAIAVRLKNNNDFPYFCSLGFPKYFIKRENSLRSNLQNDLFSVDGICENINLDCMCGMVLGSKLNLAESFSTIRGSFWTNSSTQLLQTFSEEERENIRNECNRAGYESIALIPIKVNDENIGLLQLNDRKRNLFNDDLINFFEGLCESIGIAIQIKNKEEELLQKSKSLDAKNSFLNSIYKFEQTLNRYDLSEQEIFQNLFTIILTTTSFPQFTSLNLEIENHIFESENFLKTKNYIGKKIFVNGSLAGKIQFYLDDNSPELSDEHYLDELKNFIDIIADNLENYLYQHRFEKLQSQTEMRFNSIWQNSYDGMRLTDSKGKIVAVNDAFCKLVEMPMHELIGNSFLCIYDEPQDMNINEKQFYNDYFLEKVKTGIPLEREVIMKSKKKLYLQISFSIIKWEEDDYLNLAIFRDNTLKVKSEQEIKNLETLASIGKLTTFLTHEIKSYINPIKMTLSYLSKNFQFSGNELSYFKMLKQQMERLENLVKETIEYVKQTSINSKRIHVKTMIDSLKSCFEKTLIEKQIELINNIDDRIYLDADFEKLQTVFLHLISNAVEASKIKGIIEISADFIPQENMVSFKIKDDGLEIREKGKIFEPFVTTKACGTGLGLSIAKKYLEMHKAELKLLRSEPGDTTFEIIFPFSGVKDGHHSNY